MNFTQKAIFKQSILLVLGFLIGVFAVSYIPYIALTISERIGEKSNTSNESIFITDKIQKTMNIIRKYSYGFDQKSKKEIEDDVLKSIVSGLGDKHSTYFTQKETSSFNEALRGNFEGIGAVINENPRGIKIMKIISGSPAEKAGLMAGDIITHVGGVSLLGKTTEEAVMVIRGPKASVAKITYKRGESNIEYHLDVVRGVVNVPSVVEKMLDNKIGYIEVATFGEHTSLEFLKSWNNITASGAEGVILDFRNNGGGYLETAVELASVVLPYNSPVVIIKQNDITKNETLYSRKVSKNNTNIPIIVLINDFSASASEIFAGALQDYRRALILGEKSYGKGSVQEPFDLGDQSIVKITTAKWFTPKDVNIDEKGITPDVSVFLTSKDYENIFDRQLKAAEVILVDQIQNKRTVQELKDTYKSNTFISLTK